LHVSGSIVVGSYSNTQTEEGIFFRPGFTTSNKYNLSILTYDHNSGGADTDGLSINAYDGISFCLGSNTRNEKVRISQDGNVGIGTTSPAAKLEVSGSLLDYVSFSTQTSNYTMSLSDASKLIRMNVASANTVNVPTNAQVAFRVGTKVDVLQYGAGQTTITASAGSGVQIRTANNYYKLNARYGVASLVKMGTNEWAMFGNLTP